MKEKLKKLIKEIKEKEEMLLEYTFQTTGTSNEYWLGKWSEVKTIREKLEEILDEE